VPERIDFIKARQEDMNCIWLEKISSMIDGELPADEERALERHIAGCEECQLARADFLNFRSQIVAFKPVLQPADSSKALAHILSSAPGIATQRPQRPTRAGLFTGLRFGPAFATAALLIVAGIIGLSLYLNSHRQSETGSVANTNRKTDRVSPRPGPSVPREVTAPNSNTGDVTKSGGGKSQKPKVRPVLPKLPVVPDDRVSPWANQAIAQNNSTQPARVDSIRSADTQSLTAHHLEQSELLLRSFRNVRTDNEPADISYEKRRAQRLVYQNIVVRREADTAGDVQVATLLDSLEPILLDIANLPDKPQNDQVMAIKERLRRKNIVALLQVNSTSLARAND
jgi:hypothetical protein